MATHSSTLAWEIPWREEPGRLQSTGSLRVGHDWVTSLPLFTFMYWRRKWQPTPVFLPGESCGQRSLVGCCPWGRTELDTTEATACMHALEKEMATHSSSLAWRIPGTEEPGWLPSMGSHRVGHDWSDLAAAKVTPPKLKWLNLTSSYFGVPPQLPQGFEDMVSNQLSFPGGSEVNNVPASAGDRGLIPGSGRSSGEGNGNPLQYSCLENSIDRGAWRATVQGVAKELDAT